MQHFPAAKIRDTQRWNLRNLGARGSHGTHGRRGTRGNFGTLGTGGALGANGTCGTLRPVEPVEDYQWFCLMYRCGSTIIPSSCFCMVSTLDPGVCVQPPDYLEINPAPRHIFSGNVPQCHPHSGILGLFFFLILLYLYLKKWLALGPESGEAASSKGWAEGHRRVQGWGGFLCAT